MERSETTRPANVRVSLEDFAQKTTQCLTCNLDAEVRQQVEQARLTDPSRFSYPVICAWLEREAGRKVTESSLKRHMRHHVEARS